MANKGGHPERLAICIMLVLLRFVEVGWLRIGAFEPDPEHGPRPCGCDTGDVGWNVGRDPV
jgi:hypothetical protein